MTTTNWIEDGLPQPVKNLVGLVVRRAWIMRESHTLVVRLVNPDGGFKVLMIEPIEPKDGAAAALSIETGDEIPGIDWAELEAKYPPPRELGWMFGRKFTGIEGTFVAFGNMGVCVELEQVAIARRRSWN